MWIGLLVGIVVGAALWKLEGAIVLGFFGWIIGVIIDSRKRGKSQPVTTAAPGTQVVSLQSRVARLEIAVERLEKQLATLKSGGAVAEEAPVAAALPPEAVEEFAPEGPITQPMEQPAAAAAEPPPPPPSPPPDPPAPREPEKPNPIVAWFLGGNTIARVGLVILFFGLAFLVKYAADNDMLPIELRVAAVAAAGVALLVIGWRLRFKRPAYGLALQGGGVGVLYLTTFGAMKLYHMVPPEAAFFVMAAIAAFAAILAIKQDAMVLAIFGAGGGFLAPVLTSTGQGSHVALFSYFLILNLGIFAVAWYKAWRPLNLVGFAFTFLIGLAWGMRSYKPELFDSTEPFLVAFFVMYVAIAILFARRQAPELRHFVDGTIVFGVPLAAFGLQAGLMKGTEFGLSFSALAMSALYLILAAGLQKTKRENYTLLAETFIALGVVFATVAVPLALDARWTSAAWALEGAAIVWVGVRQDRILARAFGVLLQFAAGWAYLEGYHRIAADEATPFIDAPFIGALLVSLAGLFTNRFLKRPNVHDAERGFAPFVFAWGVAWLLFAGHHEIWTFVPGRSGLDAYVGWLTGVALVMGYLCAKMSWTEAGWASRLLMPALVPFVILAGVDAIVWYHPPFDHYGWLAWPAAFAVHFWTLRRIPEEDFPRYMSTLHVAGMIFIAILGGAELSIRAGDITQRDTAWSAGAAALIPALLVWLVSSKAADTRWPVVDYLNAYRRHGVRLMALGLVIWSLYTNVVYDGTNEPLPYLPILNAQDLAHVLVFLAFTAAWFAIERSDLVFTDAARKRWTIVACAIAFIWLNGVLLRSLHQWADVPYTFDGVRRSVTAQAALSIFWSVLALGTMVFATQTARRALWMTGAALMGVVVVKLFIVDLSRVTGIGRIVSFIAVGVLMLVIGYFSPVPPRKPEPSQ